MSHYPNIPMNYPSPDAEAFFAYLAGERSAPARPPMVEYLVDDLLRKRIGTEMLGHTWVAWSNDRDAQRKWLDNYIDFWYRMGYDFVRFESSLPLPSENLCTADTAAGAEKDRSWVDQHHGAIESWEDYETYPWPKVEEYDFFAFEYLNDHLPDGFGLIVSHAGGIFEHLSQILSLEGMSLMLYDDPDLVRAVVDRTGALMAEFYEQLHGLENISAAFQGDDMGHKTGTMIKPDHLRDYCLPWHKRFAEIAHAHNRPYFLHSCGNMVALMPDLINDVKIDGKHSFEDVIIPIEDFLTQYGDRIAALGGMDIDTLARGTENEVRSRAREIAERCAPRGRYAVGSGSSVASYIPVENYLAMLDETLGVGV